MNPSHKSGYVAIVGRPNVGKSTLLNALIGQEVAAVSSKPQTTRNKILGIKTFPDAQIVFLDTPGLHKPRQFARTGEAGSSLKSGGESLSPPDHPHHKKALNRYMNEMAEATFDDADIFLFVTEPAETMTDVDREIYEKILQKKKPVVVAINKVDKTYKKNLLPLMEAYLRKNPVAVIPISALKNDGVNRIEETILQILPEGPSYYPADQVTDRSERFLVSEIIRQEVMELTRQEVPYSVAVVVEEFQEPKEGEARPLTRIRAIIMVEKDSQKAILIGAKGSMIKKIGEISRGKIESLVGTRVYLELFVRVEKDWAQDLQKVEELVGG